MDLIPVLMEGLSTTSTATRAQSLVELYGVLPTVSDDGQLGGFASKRPLAATGQGLASPLARMCSVD